MRARLHVRDGRVGFFLEGTHEICDAALTGQLLPERPCASVQLRRTPDRAAGLGGDADIELSENRAGDERALHIEFAPGAPAPGSPALRRGSGVTGLSWSRAGGARAARLRAAVRRTTSIARRDGCGATPARSSRATGSCSTAWWPR